MSRIRAGRWCLMLLAILTAACLPSGEDPPPAGDLPTIDDQATVAAAPAGPAVLTFGKSGPVDEGGYYPDFNTFRASLLAAVEARDTVALFAAVAPDIKVSFGGDGGLQGLRDVWRINQPDSELWGVLRDILLHGGKFAGENSFTAPWTFMGLPDSLDAFSHLIVRGPEVSVYASADSSSKVLAVLGYDIVKAGPWDQGQPFRTVQLDNGEVGYVAADRVRSPLDYRALFEKRNGRWWLVTLVNGD